MSEMRLRQSEPVVTASGMPIFSADSVDAIEIVRDVKYVPYLSTMQIA